jgi:TRAP-type C4-dicarboxylate transport system substrate-binding protein
MKKWKKTVTTASAVALGILGWTVGTAPASAEAEKWVLGSAQPELTGFHQGIKRVFIPRLEGFSHNQIKVEPQMLTGLCSEHSCMEQMQGGLIQLSTASSENAGAFGTTIDILNLPYIFKDLHWADQIVYDWLLDELNPRAEKTMGFRMVSMIVNGGYRQTIQNMREVRAPGDLNGIKIRVTKSPAAFNLFKSWGAQPVPYDWAQLYQGLQSKVVNGMYIPTPWLEVTKMYEVADHVTYTGGAIVFNGLYVNAGFYNGLKPDIRKALDMAGDSLQRLEWAFDDEWLRTFEQRLRDKNVKFYTPTDAEMDLWREKAIAVWVDQAKIDLDKPLARRILAEQGMDLFIGQLEKAGVL